MKLKPKIMFLDIETSMCVVYSWGVGSKISIGHENIIEERKIICICWKYAGNKTVHSLTWDSKQDDKAMLKKFIKELNSCDVAIGHNGDNFDLKTLKTRIIYHQLNPVTNIVSIDTLKLSRSNFRFTSNRLDYIGKYLGVGQKLETGGYGLWKDVMAGKKVALDKMVRYCKRDVVLLEDVFNKLRPYVNNMPVNMSILFNNDRDGCPSCGSLSSHKHDIRSLKSGRYQRYRCQDCGHIWRDGRMLKKKPPL